MVFTKRPEKDKDFPMTFAKVWGRAETFVRGRWRAARLSGSLWRTLSVMLWAFYTTLLTTNIQVCFCLNMFWTDCTSLDYSLSTQPACPWVWLITLALYNLICQHYCTHMYMLMLPNESMCKLHASYGGILDIR